ncbi:MAG: hypothetical protein VX323_06980, partial [Pseudomonadota bacterium]|nr:hypothetical protein [Pseudomonadota bacterium]
IIGHRGWLPATLKASACQGGRAKGKHFARLIGSQGRQAQDNSAISGPPLRAIVICYRALRAKARDRQRRSRQPVSLDALRPLDKNGDLAAFGG